MRAQFLLIEFTKSLLTVLPIALADKPLTVNGSVAALENSVVGGRAIALERDLFVNASLQPAEILNFQAKDYHLLHEVIKEPEFISQQPS